MTKLGFCARLGSVDEGFDSVEAKFDLIEMRSIRYCVLERDGATLEI